MKDIYVKFNKPLNGKDIKGESRDAIAEIHHELESGEWQRS